MSDKDTSAAVGPCVTTYFWRQGFAMFTPTFVLDRSDRPYRRLSATFILARGKPFLLETDPGAAYTGHAALIAPNVQRRRIQAVDSDILIVDLAITMPEYAALKPLLLEHPVCGLDAARLASVASLFDAGYGGELDSGALQDLLSQIVVAVTGRRASAPAMDSRVARVFREVDQQALGTVDLASMAKKVHLSPSRLRHVFREEAGCSLSQYARWAATWKCVWLWSRRRRLCDAADDAGFHDLPHVNRAFKEIFGITPSTISNLSRFRVIRCKLEG